MTRRPLSVEPPDHAFWPTVKGLARLWTEQNRLVGLGLACAFVYSGLAIAIPIVIRHAIDDSIAPTNGHHAPLWPYLVTVAGLALLRFGVNFLRRWFTSRTGIRVEARMRELLYQSYLRYPRAFYDRHATGQVVSRATNDLYPIRYFIGWGMTQGIQSLMMIGGIAVVLFYVNAKLAAIALISMPAVFLLAFTFARKVMPISRQVQQLKADVTEAADEAVVGIEMVQAFGREDDVQARFAEKAEKVRDGVLRQARVEAAFLPGLLFLPTLSIAAVLLFGGRDVIGGALTYGEFFLFYQLLLQLVWPLEALGWILSLAQRATASASRSFAWLDEIETIPEPSHPTQLPAGRLSVRFEDVRFGYGTGSEEVLSGIELQVEPGEIVAICGPTGVGKTSLLNLIPRFYDPTDGRVLVGGVDVRDVTLHDLRSAVAIVTQKPVLFSIPLRENLLAARPDAPWEEVVAACEAAGVAHFAAELPEGYDTLIGERGVNLSGGQRQRVALARALVAGARIVVLDDPMSAVDTQTERHLVENLRPALAGRTVLLAAQRLSTVEVADRAIVLDDGVVVESGTPSELLALNGLFFRLFGEEIRAAAWTGLSRLARYLRGKWLRVAALSVVGVLSAAAPVSALFVVQDAIDNGMQAGDSSRLTRDVLIYLGINALAWVLQTTLVRGLASVGQGIVLGLREDLFDHLTQLSLRYFSQQKAGWIIARLTSDVDALSDVLSQGLTTLVVNTLTLCAAVVGLFILDWRLGLVALVILPPTLVLTRWFQVRSHAAFLQVRETISGMTAQIAESVSGMAVIQAFNRERAFLAEFDSANDANLRTNTYAQTLNSVFFPAIEFLGAIATVAVLGVGGRMVTDDTLSIGTLVSAVFLLNLVFQPLQELSDLYGQVQSAGAAMEKITTVLDTEPLIRDEPGSLPAPRVDGDLHIDHVTFSYGREPVLHALDIHVPAGGCLALVGESGGGKSTTAKLVGRFYDPDDGVVRVDGRDLRELRIRSYRRQLGVVLQDPFLFAGTIADNIRFARPEATDAQVEDVARAVGVDRIARRFERGLLHEVREGGSGLSAGERQLISIARALLADPRILILDEATSNIDRPTEILIERALDRLLSGRTSIIIAHRLATVRRADEVIVLEHGRIAQRGGFDELLAVAGPFRELASQLQGASVPPVEGSRESSSKSVARSSSE